MIIDWKWVIVTVLVMLSLIVTIIAGFVRINYKVGDIFEGYDRLVRWVKAAQIMWAITGLAVLIVNAMASS